MTPLLDRLRRAARPVLAPLLVVAGYLILHAALAAVTEDRGLLAPWGSLHWPTVALGALVIAWKLVVIFVVPWWLVYRLLEAALDRIARRAARRPDRGSS